MHNFMSIVRLPFRNKSIPIYRMNIPLRIIITEEDNEINDFSFRLDTAQGLSHFAPAQSRAVL